MLKFALKGSRLKGNWALIRLKGKEGERKNNWIFLKERDEYTKNETGISQFNTSIRTRRTMAEIEAGEGDKITRNPFDKVDVQLAKLVNQVPDGEDWLYEMKYDGYRMIAFLEGRKVRLVTRNGNDYTTRFHDISTALAHWSQGRTMVLDGEMTVINLEGKTDFQALQNYMKGSKGQTLTYILFDILALDGKDLRGQPIMERKKVLESLMEDAPKNLYYSRHVEGNGDESFRVACEAGMEGIIGKKADSLYTGTRNGDWIKLKCDRREEFIIGGYTLTDKKTRGISSILLGIYEGEELVYVGRAGTGFSRRTMEELEVKFQGLVRGESPFKISPKERSDEKITWIEPVLVAEIKFAEWTEKNLLRQASFKGLRTDKDPKEVKREPVSSDLVADLDEPKPVVDSRPKSMDVRIEKREKVEPMGAKDGSIIVQGVTITSPDKVIFDNPEITKAQIVDYYEMVAEHMLPYVSHRILSIVRCPKGVSQACFYKKHPDSDKKGVSTIYISSEKNEAEEYFYVENVSGLLSEVQMNTLEFHTWGSRVNNLEKPDIMVFDLDPDEGMDLSRVRQGVMDVKSILDELSLKSYLKTSGGKGYHIVVPLTPSVSWDVFHSFAKQVAEIMEKKWPDRYTSNVRKDRRKGKIFIDWIRNGRGATSIAPYSLRARKGAKVSMPISWEELDSINPDGISLSDALGRLGGPDPWKDFFQTQDSQRLK
jgi:bifunctional non-homologous end joining protein LigD